MSSEEGIKNLKPFVRGKSGNPRGRPKAPKSQEQNIADLRGLLDLIIDDEIIELLPMESESRFLEKVKREGWTLEKLMDFCAIIGSLSGQQASYSYYREIKDRVYGKTEVSSDGKMGGPKTALERLDPIKKKRAKGRGSKKEHDEAATILSILDEIKPGGFPETTGETEAEDERSDDGIIAEIRELDRETTPEADSISITE